MIINPLSLRIDKLIISITIFEVVSLLVNMSIEAAIFERAFTLAFIKHTARNFSQCLLVLINKVFFVDPYRFKVRWNDKITGLTADGASSEVVLGRALIVGCTPRSNALQAENVITAVKHTKLASWCQHLFKANLAFCIILSIKIIIACLEGWYIVTLLVRKAALGPILAAIWLKEHADALLWRSSTLVLQELIYPGVILVWTIPIFELILVSIKANLPCSNSLYNTNFYWNRVIAEYYSLPYFTLR